MTTFARGLASMLCGCDTSKNKNEKERLLGPTGRGFISNLVYRSGVVTLNPVYYDFSGSLLVEGFGCWKPIDCSLAVRAV